MYLLPTEKGVILWNWMTFMDDCEPPHGCLELNVGPLEEQPVLFSADSPAPIIYLFICLESHSISHAGLKLKATLFSLASNCGITT